MSLRLLPLLTNAMDPNTRPSLARPLDIAKSGMSVQRLRMEVAVNNLANAETTRTAAGGPYRRRVVRIEEAVREGAPPAFPPLPLSGATPGAIGMDPSEALGGVRAVSIEEDPSAGPLIYDPGHPDANATGYVQMPNVNVTTELLEMQEAKRLYEANSTVFQAAKQLLRRTLDI